MSELDLISYSEVVFSGFMACPMSETGLPKPCVVSMLRIQASIDVGDRACIVKVRKSVSEKQLLDLGKMNKMPPGCSHDAKRRAKNKPCSQ